MDEIKPFIRSLLMSLGGEVSEKQFRKEYFIQEGESFNKVLFQEGKKFSDFMKTMSDVCRVKEMYGEVFIQRVSNEVSGHMDLFSHVKKKKPTYNSSFPVSTFPISKGPFGSSPIVRRSQYNSTRTSTRSIQPILRSIPSSRQVHASQSSSHRAPMKPNPPQKPRHHDHPPPLPPHLSWNPVIYKRQTESNETDKADEKAKEIKTVLSDPILPDPEFSTSKLVDAEIEPSTTPITEHYNPFVKEMSNKGVTGFPKVTNPFLNQSVISPSTSDNIINENKENMVNGIAQEKKVAKTLPKQPLQNRLVAAQKIDNESKRSIDLDSNKNIQVTIRNLKKAEKVVGESNENTLSVAKIPNAHIKTMKSRMFFEIIVKDTISPSQFYFQFDLDILKKLMEAMYQYYEGLKDCNHIKPKSFDAGSHVAVLKDENWYRAEIHYVSEDDVLVSLVDFGLREYVKKSNIRVLEDDFMEPSRKSCKGSLFGVKPSDGELMWKPEAIVEFMKKTKGRKVHATVKACNDEFFELSIVDDVFSRNRVSDYLIEQGKAVKDEGANYAFNAILV